VVASYNIRYAVGQRLISGSLMRRLRLARPRRRPSLVARNIAKAARAFSDERLMPRADVIALQEADRQTQRSGGRDVARELAERLQMNYARAGAATPLDAEPLPKQWYLDFEERITAGETGDTGVATLSRLPLAGVERVELPCYECAWRPRLALHAVVPFGASRLHVFNTHIDPHATLDEQLSQHAAVLKRAAEFDEREPRLLLGDFNTLVRRARTETRRLLEAHGYRTPLPDGTGTWRAGLLRLHADWIFARGLRIVRWGVARPLRVSDHWPVWVEVEDEG
ncbi:MAG TPA: endonuclease/exonuclease/phosphatase family protein, partial [Pyrinomonadaceae bacterium]|nr:endonuclease/exonuclease/phosphatase family protein [Pyrinomonadaceae bacterium]